MKLEKALKREPKVKIPRIPKSDPRDRERDKKRNSWKRYRKQIEKEKGI